MTLSRVRRAALDGFLFPRHMAPALMRPVGAKTEPAYHEMCGFMRASGYRGANPMAGAITEAMARPMGFEPLRPDLLDVLRAPKLSHAAQREAETFAKKLTAE